jgi:hypothetical protein
VPNLTLVLAVVAAQVLSGCSQITAPTASTPNATVPVQAGSTIGLTVRVLVRGSEEPVAAATVFRNNAAVGQTDVAGMLKAQVPIGIEFSIDVTAPGFVGCGAMAKVTSEERWTFYLEREASGS